MTHDLLGLANGVIPLVYWSNEVLAASMLQAVRKRFSSYNQQSNEITMNWYIRTSKVYSLSDWEARLRVGQKRIGICGKICMSFVEVPGRVQSVHSDQSKADVIEGSILKGFDSSSWRL